MEFKSVVVLLIYQKVSVWLVDTKQMTGNQLNKTWNVSDGFGLIEGKHVHGISTSVPLAVGFVNTCLFSFSLRLKVEINSFYWIVRSRRTSKQEDGVLSYGGFLFTDMHVLLIWPVSTLQVQLTRSNLATLCNLVQGCVDFLLSCLNIASLYL